MPQRKTQNNAQSSYTEKVRKIQNNLGKYTNESFLAAAIRYLSKKSESQISDLMRLPWLVFLLIKWAMLSKGTKHRKVTEKEFLAIASQAYKLQSEAAFIENQSAPLFITIRPLLLQQIHFQEDTKEHLLSLTRQSLWFLQGEHKYYYDSSFIKIAGISLESYLTIARLLVSLSTVSSSHATKITTTDLIYNLCPAIKPAELYNFLRLTGSTLKALPAFFKKYEYENPEKWEFFEETPLSYKPILIDGDRCWILNSTVCMHGLCTLIPTLLKESEKEQFKSKFGQTLERYVEGLLKRAEIPYINENNIKQIIGKTKKTKIVDFAIGADSKILVDSKAIEPNRFAKTCSSREILKKILEESFLKGIWQTQECCKSMEETKEFGPGEYYALIVTHKDYYIKSAEYVESQIDHDLSKQIEEKYGKVHIPLRRTYYCTISDLEIILEEYKARNLNIKDFIDFCADQDQNPATSRIHIRHHIAEYSKSKTDPRRTLIENHETEDKKLTNLIKQNNQYWQRHPDELIFRSEQLRLFLNKKNN